MSHVQPDSHSTVQGAAACVMMPSGSAQQCRSPAMPVAPSATPAAGRRWPTAFAHQWAAPSAAASCMRGLRHTFAAISHIGAGAPRGQPHRQRCSVPAVADAPAVECDALDTVAVQPPGPDGSRPRCVRAGRTVPAAHVVPRHVYHHCFTAPAPAACTWRLSERITTVSLRRRLQLARGDYLSGSLLGPATNASG